MPAMLLQMSVDRHLLSRLITLRINHAFMLEIILPGASFFSLDHWECTSESQIPEKLAESLLFCGEDCKEVSYIFFFYDTKKNANDFQVLLNRSISR